MSLVVLSARDVDTVVSQLQPSVLETLMAFVFHKLSSGSDYASPHRISISMAQHTALFMPSRMPGLATTMKVVSIPTTREVAQRGLPASTLVLDEMTGRVKAVVNATTLTALRTAAGSVLATRLLVSRVSKTLVVFGAGKQIKAHVDLLLRAFSTFKSCVVVNRTDNARLHDLLSSLHQLHPHVTFDTLTLDDQRVEDAVRRADVICTATSSTQPLFPSEWVSAGTHLNLVGSFTPDMHEVDSNLINRAWKVVVDSRDACALEAGELISAGKTADPQKSLIEIGELVREDDDDGTFVLVQLPVELKATADGVTIFKSVGIGIQDVAIASLVVSYARDMDLGTRIENYDV